jgi:hypothetical protein
MGAYSNLHLIPHTASGVDVSARMNPSTGHVILDICGTGDDLGHTFTLSAPREVVLSILRSAVDAVGELER